jgi:hypothetical protein
LSAFFLLPLSFALTLTALPSALAGVGATEVDTPVVALPGSARECLRCHAMATLGYRDPATWEIVDLAIDPDQLVHSEHGALACDDCHSEAYRRYPHPKPVGEDAVGCIACHEEGADSAFRFDLIAGEFAASVHATIEPGEGVGPLDCSACHDPHAFRVAQVGEPLAVIVGRHNAICLDCHQEQTEAGLPRHAWLPSPEAHWRAVRCVDCHTPAGAQASHQIQPAAEAARNCVGCHSRSAELLGRLYAFRSEEELSRRGLLGKAVVNDAYIIGMSRSPTLDRVSLLVLGLLTLGLAAHGLGRYLTGRARRRRS